MPFPQDVINLVNNNLPYTISRSRSGSLECVFSDSVAKNNFVVGMRNLINSSENPTLRRMIVLKENSSIAVTLDATSDVIALFLKETGLNLEKPPIPERAKRVAELYLAIFAKNMLKIEELLPIVTSKGMMKTLSPAVNGPEMSKLREQGAGTITPIEFAYTLNDSVFFNDFLNLVFKFYDYESVINFYFHRKKTAAKGSLVDTLASWQSPLVKAAAFGQWGTVQTLLKEPDPNEAQQNYRFVLSEALRTKQAGALIMSLVSLLWAIHKDFEVKISAQLVFQHRRVDSTSQFFFAKPTESIVKVKKEEEEREEVRVKNVVISDKFFDVVHTIVNTPVKSFPAKLQADFIALRTRVLEIMSQYAILVANASTDDQALAFFKLSSLMDVFELYKVSANTLFLEFIADQYSLLVTGGNSFHVENTPEENAEKRRSARSDTEADPLDCPRYPL